jgi:hypothetical protein
VSLILGYPPGWWALAALGGILLIHLLQLQAKKVEISTLFLVEYAVPSNREGRALDQLRHSIPLWLQLLTVLLITWLLLEPRWMRPQSIQRVVIVLDSSLSMAAFQDRLTPSLLPVLRDLSRAAGQTEWVVMVSHTSQGVLYNGGSIEAVQRVLTAWQPTTGTHDVLPALRLAESLVESNDTLLFVSDHVMPLPAGVQLFTVGSPIDNVGFTGMQIAVAEGQTMWQALVRNYSSTSQQRAWHLQIDGQPTAPQPLSLSPRQSTVLRGVFPDAAQALQLVLSADAFDLDNHLPLVRPVKKRLRIRSTMDAPASVFFTRFFAAHDDLQPPAERHAVDLTIGTISAQMDASLPVNGIYFTPAMAQPDPVVRRGAVAAVHPLTAGLSWHDLWVRSRFPLSPDAANQVLVWLQDKPLILLRQTAGARQLLFNFHVADTNALQLPAFVVLLHRFAEQVRAQKVGFQQVNVEINQLLNLAVSSDAQPLAVAIRPIGGGTEQQLTVPLRQAPFLRAPYEPAFVEVKQGKQVVEKAAVYFADAREADFKLASSYDGVSGQNRHRALKNSEQDVLFPLWVILLGCALLGNWYFAER